MTVRVTFLGTGSAFADGGRSHACIHVGAPGVSLLLDCGGSALPMIQRHLDRTVIDGIAVTHLHGDHFGGIPFFIVEQHWAAQRTRPLTIGGPPGLPARLRRAEEAFYPEFFGAPGKPSFPIRELTLGPAETEIGGARVSAYPVSHVPESEPHGLRVRAGGKTIAYSGDASWSDDLVRLAKGADLFICECTNFERKDPVHINYRMLMRHRDELDCERIVLTHLTIDMLDRLAEVELPVASEGMTLDL